MTPEMSVVLFFIGLATLACSFVGVVILLIQFSGPSKPMAVVRSILRSPEKKSPKIHDDGVMWKREQDARNKDS